MRNPKICVDFDGVIHSYSSGWQGVDVIPDPPVEGSIHWLKRHLPRLGYDGPVAMIYSARSKYPEGIGAMKKWLLKYGFNQKELDKLAFPTQKPVAFVTIDDLAICFEGKFPPDDVIMGFKPWYKREQHDEVE